jgi:hypothetical protein
MLIGRNTSIRIHEQMNSCTEQTLLEAIGTCGMRDHSESTQNNDDRPIEMKK